MTLTTLIKSGNVPLILLGSDWKKDDSDPTKEYPYARAMLGLVFPAVATTNLKNESANFASRGFTLWLPTPVASLSVQPKRTLSISWSVNVIGGSLPALNPVKFQTWLLSLPARPPNSTTQFTQFFGEPVALSSEKSVVIGDTAGVTILNDVEGASTNTPQGEDMVCVLRVGIPSLQSTNIQPTHVSFNIVGLAVDQW